ncbi:MAG: hypothetical protein AAGJ40_13430 [Planctomycetota bacterium]
MIRDSIFVAATWGVFVALTGGAIVLAPESRVLSGEARSVFWLVACGSLPVAMLSLAPRYWISPNREGDSNLLPGFIAGMLIRVSGTVALFLVSSYYLGGSEIWTAGWVLFWHVLLLSAEVMVIARSAREFSASPSSGD